MTRRFQAIAMFLLGLGLVAAAPTEPVFEPGQHVIFCPIEEMIEDGVTVLVERAVREAREGEAAAIVFEVDTPGGLVDAAIDISNAILEAPCPTIAYIKGMGAISAGALISYACDDMTMTESANIGAATPILLTPTEGPLPTDEKSVSFLRAKFRSLAEANGYNPDIAEAMVDRDIELRAYRLEDGRIAVASHQPGGSTATADQESLDQRIVDIVIDAIEAEGDVEVPGELRETAREIFGGEEVPFEAALPAPIEGEIPPEGKVLLPQGKLLTLTAREAQQFGLIETTCLNRAQVMGLYGYAGMAEKDIVPTWAEEFFRFLTSPTIAGLLFMIGVGAIYLEVRTPGFGVPGVVGIVCLCLFFGAHYVLGVAEWVDILLVVTGLVLLLVEVFVLPGFGVAGTAGILCLIAGMYLSLTKVAIPQYSWEFDRLDDAAFTMIVSILSMGVLTVAFWKLLPMTPMYNWIVLSATQEAAAGFAVQGASERTQALGLEGVATSALRPAGRGRFAGKTYDVVSRSEFVEKGTPIVIVQVEGNRYVVDPIRPA